MAFQKTGRDSKSTHIGFVVPNPRPTTPTTQVDERPTLTVPPPSPPQQQPQPQKLDARLITSLIEPGRDYELVTGSFEV